MAETNALDAAIRGLAAAVERAKAEVGASAGERQADRASQGEWIERALAAEARVADAEAQAADAEARVADAEARVTALEDELALVLGRVEAFEYGVRVALLNAFKLVRDVSDRVGSLLGRTPLGELPKLLGPAHEAGVEPGAGEASGAGVTASARWTGADRGLETDRLDAALERLRASTERREDDV